MTVKNRVFHAIASILFAVSIFLVDERDSPDKRKILLSCSLSRKIDLLFISTYLSIADRPRKSYWLVYEFCLNVFALRQSAKTLWLQDILPPQRRDSSDLSATSSKEDSSSARYY